MVQGLADVLKVLKLLQKPPVREPEYLPSVERPEFKSETDILGDFDISFDRVQHELKSLDCFKSYGPDGVHPKLLKSSADDSSFVDAVVKLFRKCTDSGKLPQVWKSANLSAFFKSGSKTDPLLIIDLSHGLVKFMKNFKG